MQYPLVYVIVLNWNGRAHLQTCLSSLLDLDYPNVRCLMVDNGSKDDSVSYVKRNFQAVHVMELRKNKGFAEGNNHGIKHALAEGADYVCLLNTDMEVDPGWVKELVNKAESDPTIGACASKMLYFFNRCFINGVGTCLNRIATGWDQHNGRFNSDGLAIDEECLGFSGGACLLRSSALKEVGLLDAAYFMYSEDTDLSVRMWQKGYRVVTAPKAVVYHKYSASIKEGSPRKAHLVFRNRLYFIAKFYPFREIRAVWPEVARKGMDIARTHMRANHYTHTMAVIAACMRFVLSVPRLVILRLLHGDPLGDKAWSLIKPTAEDVLIKRVLLRDPEERRFIPRDKIVMGLNDYGLGEGWYCEQQIEDGAGDIGSAFRWATKRAVAYLHAPCKGRLLIKLELANCHFERMKTRLDIFINDSRIGDCSPTKEWQTFCFPFDTSSTDLVLTLISNPTMPFEITGELADLGVQVKEIRVVLPSS